MVTYRNPWHNPSKLCGGPAFYRADSKPVVYRGCHIYRIQHGHYDVVKSGICLTQRGGLQGAKLAIDNMLDNPDDFWAKRMLSYLNGQTGWCDKPDCTICR